MPSIEARHRPATCETLASEGSFARLMASRAKARPRGPEGMMDAHAARIGRLTLLAAFLVGLAAALVDCLGRGVSLVTSSLVGIVTFFIAAVLGGILVTVVRGLAAARR
jgi:hypothetical protein